MNLLQHELDYFKAFELAVKAHLHQQRKGDLMPYISHLNHVVSILIRAGYKDNKLLISALLHDVIEDTEVTASQLEIEFGTEVMSTVLEVSDDKGLCLKSREKAQLKNAHLVSKNAKLIKLADGISNATLLPPNWSIAKAEKSLAHLKLIAEICADVCTKLPKILLETIDSTLKNHNDFVSKKLLELDAWLSDKCIYFSFKNDTFYYVKSNCDNDSFGSEITGKYGICLQVLRPKKLTVMTGENIEITVESSIDEKGLSNIKKLFLAECCRVQIL